MDSGCARIDQSSRKGSCYKPGVSPRQKREGDCAVEENTRESTVITLQSLVISSTSQDTYGIRILDTSKR